MGGFLKGARAEFHSLPAPIVPRISTLEYAGSVLGGSALGGPADGPWDAPSASRTAHSIQNFMMFPPLPNAQAHLPGPPATTPCRAGPEWRLRSGAAEWFGQVIRFRSSSFPESGPMLFEQLSGLPLASVDSRPQAPAVGLCPLFQEQFDNL